jgi:hypothetical protein
MAKNITLAQLKNNYELSIYQYIEKFCSKQELELEHWIGDDIGGIACFGDVFFFNFSDIVWDINSKQPKHLIKQWIYDCIDNPEKHINYYSYSKGLRFKDLNK